MHKALIKIQQYFPHIVTVNINKNAKEKFINYVRISSEERSVNKNTDVT